MSRMWMTVLAPMLVMAGIVPGRAQPEETAGAAWDRRYSREMYLYGKEPVDFLRQVAGRPAVQSGHQSHTAGSEHPEILRDLHA